MAAAEETVERDTVVSMFKALEESMKSLKSDNVAIRERLDNLEAPPQASGVVKDSFKEHVAQDSGSVANTCLLACLQRSPCAKEETRM